MIFPDFKGTSVEIQFNFMTLIKVLFFFEKTQGVVEMFPETHVDIHGTGTNSIFNKTYGWLIFDGKCR